MTCSSRIEAPSCVPPRSSAAVCCLVGAGRRIGILCIGGVAAQSSRMLLCRNVTNPALTIRSLPAYRAGITAVRDAMSYACDSGGLGRFADGAQRCPKCALPIACLRSGRVRRRRRRNLIIPECAARRRGVEHAHRCVGVFLPVGGGAVGCNAGTHRPSGSTTLEQVSGANITGAHVI